MTEVRPSTTTVSLGAGYLLHSVIGRGSVGVVWRGSRRADGSSVAVKMLRPELARDVETVTRFLRERAILLSLEHPHVIDVLDLVAEGDTLAIVMELVDGPDLRSFLNDRGSLALAEIGHVGAQMAWGLRAAHDAGIVHRDLKPENVLLETRAGALNARITDFGTARLAQAPDLLRLTGFAGTPAYIAPEIATGASASPSSDLYSLGVVLYEMSVGRPPFAADNPFALLRMHVESPLHRPEGMDGAMWAIVAELLEKDPERRLGDASDIAERLCEICANEGGSPPVLRELDRPRSQPAPVAPESAPDSRSHATIVPSFAKATTGQPSEIGSSPRPRRRLFALAATSAVLVASAGAWLLAGTHQSNGGRSNVLSVVQSRHLSPESALVDGERLTTFAVPPTGRGHVSEYPAGIVADTSGVIWVTEVSTQRPLVGRLVPSSGSFVQYSVPQLTGYPSAIASGSGSTIWVADSASRRIVEILPTLKVVVYDLSGHGAPSRGSGGLPTSLVSGPGDAEWFTESGDFVPVAQRVLLGQTIPSRATGSSGGTAAARGTADPKDAVGVISPTTRRVSTTSLPSPVGSPVSIAAHGSEVWVLGTRGLAQVSLGDSGPIVERVVPLPATWIVGRDSQSLTVTNQGTVWIPFRDSSNPNLDVLAALDPRTGSLNTRSTTMVSSQLSSDIASGASDDLWFSTLGGNSIGHVLTDGTVTSFRVSSVGGSSGAVLPLGVAVDPASRSAWFTELRAGSIGEISVAPR